MKNHGLKFAFKLLACISFLYSSNIFALATCSPANCTAACDSSCSYQTCTKVVTVNIQVKDLPFTLNPIPADACEFNADTLNEIPFYVDSLSYTEIPATVEKKYKVCETKTKSGPSCGP